MSHDLYRVVLRNDLLSFIRQSFATAVPGATFHMNWHIDALAHALERCRRREIKRLIVLMPPRNLKSISVSVAFPAYILGKDPSAKIICASYSQELANKHARDGRAVMESDWFRSSFPQTRIGPERAAVHDFQTTKRGGRLATSVGGTLTGRGGCYIIIDDPMKPDDATSESARAAVIDWFKNTVLSRLDDKSNDVIIVVMQRLHEEDLAGVLMVNPQWRVLELPAIAEDDKVIPLTFGRTMRRRAGDVLSPTREPREILDGLKRDMGSYVFAAQYQQRPAPLGGGLIKWHWFQTYDEPPKKQAGDQIVQSWDVANTISETSDYSVCTTWLRRGPYSYLLHVVREKLEYPALRNMVLFHAASHEASIVLIEKKNAGEPLIQELRQVSGINPLARDPKGDKETRMYIETPAIESGRVYLPKDASWLADFRAEICTFPKGKHDDQIDSLSQYLDWVREKANMPMPSIRFLGSGNHGANSRVGTYYRGGSLSDFMRYG